MKSALKFSGQLLIVLFLFVIGFILPRHTNQYTPPSEAVPSEVAVQVQIEPSVSDSPVSL